MKTTSRANAGQVSHMPAALFLAAMLLLVLSSALYVAGRGVSDKSASRGGMCSTSTDCVCIDGLDGGRACGGEPIPRSLHPLIPRDMARVP